MLVEALTNSVEHPRTYVPLIPQPTLQPRAVARRLRVEGGAWRASDLIRLAEKGGSLVRSDWLGGWLAGARTFDHVHLGDLAEADELLDWVRARARR